MKRIITAAALLGTGACLPYGETQTIVVDGEGVVMATPEVFTISARLSASGQDETEAFAGVSASLAKMLETLPALDGAESLQIDSSTAGLRPIFDVECLDKANYQQRSACSVTSYFGEITIKVV